MPLYFFEITKNGKASRAEMPLNLHDIDAAWEEATVAASQLIKELDGSLKPGTDWSVGIEDEFRNKLRTLTISAKAHK